MAPTVFLGLVSSLYCNLPLREWELIGLDLRPRLYGRNMHDLTMACYQNW